MKKKVIFGTVAALFLGAGIFTSVNLTEKHQMSNLTLANIEALTKDRDFDLPDNFWFDDDEWNTTEEHKIGSQWHPTALTCYYEGVTGTEIVCTTGNGNCSAGTSCIRGSFPR